MSYCSELICPRLIDYLAIVGLRDPNKSSKSHVLIPELLRRYPTTDHHNSALPPDVVYFCQPDGCFNSVSSILNKSSSGPTNANQFVFSLTDKETGTVRYGVCLNFLRPIDRRTPLRSPKHRHSSKPTVKCTPSQTASKPKRNKPKTHSLTSLLIVSHHPMFRAFYTCLAVLKQIIEKFHARTVKRTNSRESLWSALLGAVPSDCQQTTSVLYHDLLEIETWIYRLLSCPVPVPGLTKLQIHLLPPSALTTSSAAAEHANDPITSPLVLALPDTDRFQLADFPLHSIFELMGVEFALKLLLAIILENKVIVQSKSYAALSHTILSIKTLLYPLEYMFPVVLLLPTIMPDSEQLFMVPSPFIIGVPSSFMLSRPSFHLPVDILLFDVDRRCLLRCDNKGGLSPSNIDQYLSLPPSIDFNFLTRHIKQALISISDAMQPIKNLEDIITTSSAQSQPNKPYSRSVDPLTSQSAPSTSGRSDSVVSSTIADYNPLIFGNDSDSVDISTRIAMIRFFNSCNILGNFNRYTRTLKLYPKPIVAFQTNNFLRSRRLDSDFIRKLTNTQAILSYGEWNIAPTNGVVRIILEDGCHDPRFIGDKAKWYAAGLELVDFRVYRDEGAACTLHLLDLGGAGRAGSSSEESTAPSDSADVEEQCSSQQQPLLPPGLARQYSWTSSCSSDVPATATEDLPLLDGGVAAQLLETTTDSGFSATSNECQRSTSIDLSKVYHPPTYLHIPNIDKFISSQSPGDPTVTTTSDSLPKDTLTTTIPPTIPKDQLSRAPCNSSDTEEIHNRKLQTRKKYNATERPQLSQPNSPADKRSPNFTEADFYQDEALDETPSLTTIYNEAKGRLFNIFGGASKPSLAPQRSLRPSNVKSVSVVKSSDLTNRIRAAHTSSTNHSRRSSASGAGGDSSEGSHSRESSGSHQTEAELIRLAEDIMKGHKPTLWQQFKLKKLLEQEQYRNLVLSKINKQLKVREGSQDTEESSEFIEDVPIPSEDQFNAMLCICQLMILGLYESYQQHQQYSSSSASETGGGGYGSVFVLLELLHTHYIDVNPLGLHLLPQQHTIGKSTVIDASSMASPSCTEMKNTSDEQSNVFISSLSGNPLNINGEEYQNIDMPSPSMPSACTLQSPIRPRPSSLMLDSSTSQPRIHYDFQLDEKATECNGYRYRLNQLCYSKSPALPGPRDDNCGYTDSATVITSVGQLPYNSQSKLSPSSPKPRRTSLLSRLLFLGPSSPSTESNKSLVRPRSMPESTTEDGSIPHASESTYTSPTRLYLYEKLVPRSSASSSTSKDSVTRTLWHNMNFWEDIFYDAVCQEREIIGMDVNAADLLERYSTLDHSQKQKLERQEDKLLGITINNLVGFMLMMRVDLKSVRSKANCMMGKSHIGLDESGNINRLMDSLIYLKGNAVDLRLNLSRRMSAPSFNVFFINDNIRSTKHTFLLEVFGDCLLVKSLSGRILYRWWFDRIIRCSSKKNNLSIAVRDHNSVNTYNLQCRRSKDLIATIQKSWNQFNRSTDSTPNNFIVTDEVSKCTGKLKISAEGIRFITDNNNWSVELLSVRKCCTRKPDKFIIEIIDPNTKSLTYRVFKSNDYDKIAYSLLAQFTSISTANKIPAESNTKNRIGNKQ